MFGNTLIPDIDLGDIISSDIGDMHHNAYLGKSDVFLAVGNHLRQSVFICEVIG